jgi:hypothetical protein
MVGPDLVAWIEQRHGCTGDGICRRGVSPFVRVAQRANVRPTKFTDIDPRPRIP